MPEDLQHMLAPLQELPFVETLEVRRQQEVREPAPHEPDAVLLIHTPTGEVLFHVTLKRTHLTHAIADAVMARVRAADDTPWLLVAPYVPPGIAGRLADAGVNYVDAVGNCRLAIGERYFALKEGKKPDRRPPALRGVRLAGYQVAFTLLAHPEYVDLTVRELADRAGVGKTAAADALNRLAAQGLVGKGPHRQLLDPRELLDRWLAGYADTVRPRLFMGAYRTPHPDPPALEAAIEQADPDQDWAFGGGAAVDRLTHYYRGPVTVLHVQEQPRQLLRDLKALEAEDGPLVILGTPGPVGLEGVHLHTAHPLLVYTELYAEGRERPREAARVLAEEFLPDWV